MKEYDYRGKRYVCLVRASHGSEELSTDAQLNMQQEHCRQLEMAYVDKYVLDGVTGSLPGKREDLKAIIERKKTRNDFDVLVLQRLDRLTRGGPDHGFWFQHECTCAGIKLLVVGDDIPQGRYASLILAAKYEAAQEQAFSISQRSTQGSQLALEQGRGITSSHTPFGCWRLYSNSEGKPTLIIRDLRDGRQQKLHTETYEVIDTYGEIGGGSRGHYRKQKIEKPLLMPGDAQEADIVREIFRLHFIEGKCGKRIADILNCRGIRSPQGKEWSQHQVESIYEQESYTGRSVGNRKSSAIYHERHPNAPKAVDLDPQVQATAKNIPMRQRPREEWFIQDQPLMADFLEPAVRKLAMAEHEQLWQRRGDPDRPKKSKSKHKASDYLLSDLFFAKQDGGPLVGVLCGRVNSRVRYYRHRRGRRGYRKGSLFNGMFRADALEEAVVGVVREMLNNLPQLRDRIMEHAVQQAAIAPDETKVEELRVRGEQIRKRIELIVSTFDEETLADARQEIERLRAERRSLDQQVAAAEAAEQARTIDPNGLADRVIAQLAKLPLEPKTIPTFALRKVISTFVERVVGDMETKDVEIALRLPTWAFAEENGGSTMRLVGNWPSSTSDETHQLLVVRLGMVDCRYVKKSNSVCYDCRRRKAA